ncbi:hypothetical protein FG167_10000 [Lacinutrix sp. WUR7]|uniref:sulfatase-like hydrolase/transferase n=1 Tax=Lacinutrix sp. WUR7 TaxID=2653681 RepID=UPI00193CA598|nr:sulfatase-like hydrolase/transferase [Lacinutrix sp. WUR7]QRM89547.1 hypothetical protein FG167_10000 [Lacinutrix sp. WUR7]
MLSKLRNKVITFLDSKKEIPVIAAVAAGLYPFLFNFEKNFTLINSWQQFYFYCFIYLLLPTVIFVSVSFITKKYNLLKGKRKFLFPVLNFAFFTFFLYINMHGIAKKKIGLLFIFIACLLAILIYKHFKKIIVLQFILAIFVIPFLILKIVGFVSYSNKWMEQPDNIEAIVFKKTPNIYIIQVDGYANFSELVKGHYNFDNRDFENYLQDNEFKKYYNFRSNYFSTLSSNSSFFAMKHHYYNSPKEAQTELYNSRDIIVGENPVVSILKNNNYKTNLLLEFSYLLLNRPKIAYDFCNIDYSNISYFSRGFEKQNDLVADLDKAIENNSESANFYFIEKISPGHVTTSEFAGDSKDAERELYLKRLLETNIWLKKIIKTINTKDKNALIVISADHGGFVGLNATPEARKKQTDDKIIKSIFTSTLAIKWPNEAPEFDTEFKTPVNFFRILFAHLAEDASYLDNLQDDKSYMVIKKGAPYGVYELINEKGEVVFKELSK